MKKRKPKFPKKKKVNLKKLSGGTIRLMMLNNDKTLAKQAEREMVRRIKTYGLRIAYED